MLRWGMDLFKWEVGRSSHPNLADAEVNIG